MNNVTIKSWYCRSTVKSLDIKGLEEIVYKPRVVTLEICYIQSGVQGPVWAIYEKKLAKSSISTSYHSLSIFLGYVMKVCDS